MESPQIGFCWKQYNNIQHIWKYILYNASYRLKMLVLFNLGRVCSNISGSEQKTAFFSSSWEHPTCEKGVSSLKNNIGEKLIHIMSLVGMLLNLPPQNLQKNIAKTVFQPPFFRGYVKCKLRVRLQQTCIFSSYIRMILRRIDRGSSVCFFVDLGPTTIYPLPTSYPREN